MTEAYLMLREFGGRLRQVHLSEVSAGRRHNPCHTAPFAPFARFPA